MFYIDGFLHAIVDAGAGRSTAANNAEGDMNSDWEREGSENKLGSCKGAAPHGETGAAANDRPVNNTTSSSVEVGGSKGESSLSNKQRRKAERRRKKRCAREELVERNRRRRPRDSDSTEEDEESPSSPRKNNASGEGAAAIATPVLRLHQFVSTVFRSELNVAENGAGHFVKNAPRVSAHHAILRGVVRLNGEVCKLGRTALSHGDDVSLELEPDVSSKGGDLVAWRGSEEVARRLEAGAGDRGGRKGRMMASLFTETPGSRKDTMGDSEMVKYYREMLGKAWIPEVHESSAARPLPLTLRALRPSAALAKELTGLGFRPVTEEVDFSLRVSRLGDAFGTKRLSASVFRELLSDTWIACGGKESFKKDESGEEKKLGLFLSEARVTGEVMQQELTSMIPVSIIAAHLKTHGLLKKKALRFLDLCSAPGSKTCQLLSALDEFTSTKNNEASTTIDYTVVANELSPQRANWMRQRLHQQSCGQSLSNLIVTCADGRAYADMEQGSFDYILCDVPCSGDGTIRKSPKIMRKWSPKNAAMNRIVQKELLTTGLGLLKPSLSNGGFLVYSTCSLNPLENEQVISEVLAELNGVGDGAFQYELVDLSKEPLLWNGVIGDDCADCEKTNDTSSGRRDGTFLRVLPAKSHGGFFIAGVRKIRTITEGDGLAVEPPDEKGGVANDDNNKHNFVLQQNVGTGSAISYSVSPCTGQCCTKLVDNLGASAIISCGVAVSYESNENGQYVLQQGCASLASPGQRDHLAYIQLFNAELIESHAHCPVHREVRPLLRLERRGASLAASSASNRNLLIELPMNRIHTKKRLSQGLPLIVDVNVSSQGGGKSFFLPARIVGVANGDVSTASVRGVVVAKILARPQIFKRALLLP